MLIVEVLCQKYAWHYSFGCLFVTRKTYVHHCVAWTGVRKDSADCVRQLGGAGLLHAHHTAAISTETPEHLTIELHRGTS